MAKLVLLHYVNVTNHRFFNEHSLETMYGNIHRFDIAEINLIAPSTYKVNEIVPIIVSQGPIVCLAIGPYFDKLKGLKIFVNGCEFWQTAGDAGNLILQQHDIVEISHFDEINDTLTHHIVIIKRVTP